MKLIFLLVFAFLIGCTTGDTIEIIEYEEYVYQEEIEEIDPFLGMAINPLTGLWVEEDLANLRPLAFVISNIPRALPQSGISQADIIYEVLAEGGITRLVAIFTYSTADKIGPMRSTRDYFARFAADHRAVLVHHGGSPTGYSAISSLGIPNMDGMHLEGRYFWRDQERLRQSGMMEHSSYTNIQHIHQHMYDRGMDMYNTNPAPFFTFHEEFTPLENGLHINHVFLPFSNFQTSTFVYDEDSRLFRRYQRGQAHIDEYNENQIHVANIIVQFVPKSTIPNDPELRMNVNLLGQGPGYLITGGAYIPISWQKDNDNTPTTWRDTLGNPLILNPGQTWIAVIQTTAQVELSLEEDEDNIEENEEMYN